MNEIRNIVSRRITGHSGPMICRYSVIVIKEYSVIFGTRRVVAHSAEQIEWPRVLLEALTSLGPVAERTLATNEHKRDDTKGPHVLRGTGVWLAFENLGCGIVQSAGECIKHSTRTQASCTAEVNELYHRMAVNNDIFVLDVAVYE